MKKLYRLFVTLMPTIIFFGFFFLVFFGVFKYTDNNDKERKNKYKAEVEKLKRLDRDDMACINGKLFIKENDKLINQDKECEFYNNQIYLKENGDLIRLGLSNQ